MNVNMNIDMVLYLVAVICFLLDGLRGALKLKTSVQFTPIGFACITAALWLV